MTINEAMRKYKLPNPSTPEDLETRWSKVLTFGDRIEILEPVELREKLLEMVTKIQNVYGENENE